MKKRFNIQQAKIAQALIQYRFVHFYCQTQDLSDYEFEFCETLKLSNFKTFQFDLEEKEICEFIYRDEKLLSSFRKILQIQLVEILRELTIKKHLLVTEEEVEYFQNYEKEMKRKITKSLGV